jgi:FKBP-type peptidyl-prolyl cis-trans isomerase FkpA
MKFSTIAAVLVILLGLGGLAGCGEKTVEAVGTPAPQGEQTMNIDVIQTGEGEAIQAGQTAVVHYTGWLHDPAAEDNRGEKFDSSRDRGQSFSFPLGAGRVIRGWDEGVAGMLVGERRILTIPAEMGYGARGAGGVIPPNATLIFDVELLGIK